MSAVFQELSLKWNDTEYTIKPTMALLNQVEQKVSFSKIAQRLVSGDPPVSLMATALSEILRFAGARVTTEEVYAQLIRGDVATLREVGNIIVGAAYPQVGKPEEQKTPDTSTKKTKPTKK